MKLAHGVWCVKMWGYPLWKEQRKIKLLFEKNAMKCCDTKEYEIWETQIIGMQEQELIRKSNGMFAFIYCQDYRGLKLRSADATL